MTAASVCTSLQHLGVGEFRDRVGERRIVDQRDLVGAAAGDMAVERVVAGVDHGVRRTSGRRCRSTGSKIFFGRLDPVDLARRLGPKALGVGQRAGVDLVIPALFVDVHGVAPRRLTFQPASYGSPAACQVMASDYKIWPPCHETTLSQELRCRFKPKPPSRHRVNVARLSSIPLDRQQMLAGAPCMALRKS